MLVGAIGGREGGRKCIGIHLSGDNSGPQQGFHNIGVPKGKIVSRINANLGFGIAAVIFSGFVWLAAGSVEKQTPRRWCEVAGTFVLYQILMIETHVGLPTQRPI
jgi:hypothetical protein